MNPERRPVLKLHPARRGAISQVIHAARKARGWSVETTAERATEALRREAASGEGLTPDELQLWETIEIQRNHVTGLENCPAAPLADATRRARLLGVTLALGLDRALINRLAGGI